MKMQFKILLGAFLCTGGSGGFNSAFAQESGEGKPASVLSEEQLCFEKVRSLLSESVEFQKLLRADQLLSPKIECSYLVRGRGLPLTAMKVGDFVSTASVQAQLELATVVVNGELARGFELSVQAQQGYIVGEQSNTPHSVLKKLEYVNRDR